MHIMYSLMHAVTATIQLGKVKFVVRLKIDLTDWETFATGTKECLNSNTGNGEIQLLYL